MNLKTTKSSWLACCYFARFIYCYSFFYCRPSHTLEIEFSFILRWTCWSMKENKRSVCCKRVWWRPKEVCNLKLLYKVNKVQNSHSCYLLHYSSSAFLNFELSEQMIWYVDTHFANQYNFQFLCSDLILRNKISIFLLLFFLFTRFSTPSTTVQNLHVN